MGLKIKYNDNHAVQLRNRHATDIDADHGTYSIFEIAFTEDILDKEYATSAGLALRSDHVPGDLKRTDTIKRNKAKEAARAKAAAMDTESND